MMMHTGKHKQTTKKRNQEATLRLVFIFSTKGGCYVYYFR